MDYEQLLVHLGSFGRWQRCLFAIASVFSFISAVLTVVQHFVLFVPLFRCYVPICETGTYDADFASFSIPFWNQSFPELSSEQKESRSCTHYLMTMNYCHEDSFNDSMTEYCDKHIYDESEYEHSMVTEYDLGFCDGQGETIMPMTSLLGSAYHIGMFFGCILTGYTSDIIGRKYVLVLANFVSALCDIIGSFSTNIWMWFGLRVVAGCFSIGIFLNAFTISIELVDIKYRQYLGLLINVPFAIGLMFVPMMAYFIQDWSLLQLTLACIGMAVTILGFFMPESPRWLLAKGKIDEVKYVLEKGAKINKRTIPEELILQLEQQPQSEEVKKLGFFSLFKGRAVLVNTLVMAFNWMAVNATYYGLTMIAVQLNGDVYINFFLSSLIEVPSYIFVTLVVDFWGRKPLLIFCLTLSGGSLVAAGAVYALQLDGVVVFLSLAGKFGCAAAFGLLFLYTAEMYPTSIRNSALGLSYTCAKIGGTVSPYLSGITPIAIPLYILGFLGLIGAVLSFALPETLANPLPEDLEDVKYLYANSKPWYKFVGRKELKRMRQEQAKAIAI